MKQIKNKNKKSGVILPILLLQIICTVWTHQVLRTVLGDIGMFAAIKVILADTGTYTIHKVNRGANMLYQEEQIQTDSFMIEMEGLSQADIPTGCESVSTVTVLRYWGIDITSEKFIETYLPCQPFYRDAGVLYGPNPQEAFAGNPFSKNSLGCFPKVIIQALEHMTAERYDGMEKVTYANVSGEGLATLAKEYVAKGIPVLLWVTMEMQPSYEGMQYYLADGSLYTWRANEHCMVLCGYDETCYYLIDPQTDGQVVNFDKALVEMRYEEMGRHAVVVTCKE